MLHASWVNLVSWSKERPLGLAARRFIALVSANRKASKLLAVTAKNL